MEAVTYFLKNANKVANQETDNGSVTNTLLNLVEVVFSSL